MKPHWVIVVLLVLALAVPAQIVAQGSKAEQQVRTVASENMQAVLEADIAPLDRNWAAEFTAIQPNGTVMGKAELLEQFKSGKIKYDSLEESDARIRIYRNTAVMTSTWKRIGMAFSNPVNVQTRNTYVFVKRGGRWLTVLEQITRIVPPPPVKEQAAGAFTAASQVVEIADLPSASGGTQHVWYAAPAKPWAMAIVFIGGDGVVPFEADGSLKGGRSIFLRTRQLWLDQGIAVLVAGKPSSLTGIWMYRLTDAYAQDIQALVEFARARTPVPIWLFGHSLGTNAVASGASRLTGGQIAGVVFGSATTQHAPSKEIVFDVPLAAINVPALVIAHEQDACPNSPPDGGSRLRAALTGSPANDLVFFSGGEPSGGPCDNTALHSFVGLDQEVVARVATWMRSNNANSSPRR